MAFAPVFLNVEHDGAGNEDGRVGADHDADAQGQREIVDRIAAEDEQHHRHKERCQRRQQGAAQRLIDTGVQQLGKRHAAAAIQFQVFADTVEHHDRVVQRIADDGQDGRNDGQVDLTAQEREHAEGDQHVVRQRDHRANRELELEPEPQVQNDEEH